MRTFISVAVTVVALAGGAVPSAAAPPAASSSAGVTASASASPLVRVKRHYGQKPVATKVGRRYQIAFDARKGDRVRIAAAGTGAGDGWYAAASQRLLDARGRRIAVNSTGFARLPRTGAYRLRFTATSSRTQLVKLRTVRAPLGRTTTVKASRGFQYAVDVRASVRGVRRVQGTGPFGRATVSGRTVTLEDLGATFDILVSPRRSVIGSDEAWWSTKVTASQTVRLYLDVNRGGSVLARDLPAVTAPVDGDAVALPASGAVATVPAKVTDALPGHFLDVDLTPGWTTVGLAPEGQYGQLGHLARGNGLVQAPDTGDTTVVVLPSGSATSPTLRLSSLDLHDASVTLGGPTVTVPVPAAGRRILVPIADTTWNDLMRLVVSTAPAGRWKVVAGQLASWPYPRGCNGCGENERVSLTEIGTSHDAFQGYAGRWMLVEALDGQVTGEFGLGVIRQDS